MPPSTRREVRLSASLPDPSASHTPLKSIESSRSGYFLVPNMEAILENFEQFKRKHISQNREVIKTNALAQQRIRELETRIQVLEAEKVEQALAMLPMKAQLSRLQHALASIHSGWAAIGQGLASTSSDMGKDLLQETQPSVLHPVSNRVAIDRNPNAISVVKSIAKPPEIHLQSLAEDDELFATSNRPSFGKAEDDHKSWETPLSDVKDYLTSGPSRSSGFVLDIGGAPSPMGSPGLPMDIGDAFLDASRSNQATWLPTQISTDGSPAEISQQAQEDRTLARRSGRKSGRRQSGLLLQTAAQPLNEHLTMPASEAVSQLSDADDKGWAQSNTSSQQIYSAAASRSLSPVGETALQDLTNSTSLRPSESKPAARKARRQTIEPSVRTKRSSMEDLPVKPPVTPGGRKRKTPAMDSSEPMPIPPFAHTTSGTHGEAYDADHDPQTGRTRRIRKSVNYALPKLNTKMRKPDPNELVPATTPQRSALGTPVTAEVAKTGDLSDLRRQHEASASRMSPAERISLARDQGSPTRSAERKRMYDEDGNGQEGLADQADLFEIRRRDFSSARSAPQHFPAAMYYGKTLDPDSSDDDDTNSRATSTGDLDELASMEGALSDFSTSDDGAQVLTPRAGPPSSSLSAQLLSSSSDSMYTCPPAGHESASRKVILNRKATSGAPKPASLEQPNKKVPANVQLKQTAKRAELTSRAATTQPSDSGTSLAAGMKPKQRPFDAGLPDARGLSSKDAQASTTERPKTLPGTAQASNHLAASKASSDVGNRPVGTSASQRGALHSVLTNQTRPPQGTPRVGTKSLPAASTPFFKSTSRF